MANPSQRRSANLGGFILCAGLLAYAFYAQFVLDLAPCPLCIFQRVAMIALGVVFLAAALHDPVRWGARIYAVLIGLLALMGAAIAARHIHIQHLPPDQLPSCGPDLSYMLDAFPLTQTLRMVFTGSGECAEVSWTFLGLSMPAWVLMWFIALGVAGVWMNWRDNGQKRMSAQAARA